MGGETTQSQKKKVDYNSKYKLNLTSVYGDVEAYHPKIVSFDKEWNGYLYWMSYTPYPDSDEQKENPHIVGSNDLINWEVPKGLVNPSFSTHSTPSLLTSILGFSYISFPFG